MLEFAIAAQRGSVEIDLDCRLSAGWTVIFGPSGAGKSSILRVLAGLDTASRARIMLDGVLLDDTANGLHVKPGQRQTALVTQSPALFPHLDVAANIAYGLGGLSRDERRQRVADMLELVGANHLESRLPRKLSGGEAQRVALARALAPHPQLLLLDEPFSALDGAASDKLLTRLLDWGKKHNTQTVLVTHDATDAFSAAAEVVLLCEGRIIAQGPVRQILDVERERILGALALQ